jgi:hypothetical protein
MKRIVAFTLALSMCLLLITSEAQAAGPAFKPGDRVECDTVGNKNGYRKATVVPFQPGDTYNGYTADSGYFVRVEIDGWGRDSTIPCKVENLRAAPAAPAAAPAGERPARPGGLELPAATKPQPAKPAPAKTEVAADGTVGADRPILDCPIKQPEARNGASPDLELLKKVFRCQYGEKPAPPGYDGAATVDVLSMQVGRSRKWRFNGATGGGDLGGGDADTVVWPIRIAFTNKEHYRFSTTVWEGSIRIFNFFVNSFGEWQYGAAESVKRAETRIIQK